MKLIKSLPFFFIGVLTFFSCNNDDKDIPHKNEKKVEFTVENDSMDIPMARSTDTGSFVSGDAIGVFCEDAAGNLIASNKKYVWNGSRFTPTDGNNTIWIGNSSTYKYYTYYPYQATASLTSISFTLPVIQSTGKNVADLMGAINTSVAAGASTIALTFQHIFAKLNIDHSIIGKSMSSAYITSKCSGGTYNPKTGEWVSNTTAVSVTSPFVDSSTKFSCILPPQSFAVGETLGEITYSDGTKRPLGLDAALTLSSSKDNTIKLSQYSEESSEWTLKSITANSPATDIPAIGTPAVKVTVTGHQERTISTFKDGVVVSSTTETRDIDVTASATYTVASPFSIISDGSVSSGTVSASNNTSENRRSGIVSVTYGGKDSSCTIYQTAGSKSYGGWTINLSASPTTVAASGGTSTIIASVTRTWGWNGATSGGGSETSSTAPTLSISGSASLSGSTVTFNNNTTASARTATVTATFNGATNKTVTITQSAGSSSITYTFTFSNGTAEYDKGTVANTAGSFSVSITSSMVVKWNGITTSSSSPTYSVSSKSSWITVSGTTISYSANTTASTRDGEVVFSQSDSGKTITVYVTQNRANSVIIQ